MRFFITVALALMPIAVVQFFPAVSQVFIITSPPHVSAHSRIVDEPRLTPDMSEEEVAELIETETEASEARTQKRKNRRVELVQGKKNTDGMKLLSMILMLKEKK